jgi:hypothetical protein
MLYSKNGSIPKPETDGTEGWIEVSDPPKAPEGKEVIWWYPPGWVIRDPKPEGDWSWNQTEQLWVTSVTEQVQTVDSTDNISSLTTSQINTL